MGAGTRRDSCVYTLRTNGHDHCITGILNITEQARHALRLTWTAAGYPQMGCIPAWHACLLVQDKPSSEFGGKLAASHMRICWQLLYPVGRTCHQADLQKIREGLLLLCSAMTP